MKMSENERLVGIETMRSRVQAFHFSRLDRIGRPHMKEYFRTSDWTPAQVLREYRDMTADYGTSNCAAYDAPEALSDAQMSSIIGSTPKSALMG